MTELVGDVNKAPRKRGRPATVRPLIIKYVQDNPGITTHKIAVALGKHDTYISSVMGKLRRSEQVERNNEGGYSWVGRDDLLDDTVATQLQEVLEQQGKEADKSPVAPSSEDEDNNNSDHVANSASEIAEDEAEEQDAPSADDENGIEDSFDAAEEAEDDSEYELEEEEEDVIDLSSQIDEDEEEEEFATSYEYQ